MSTKWSAEDDALLRELVTKYNKQWAVIAQHFPSKTPSQVASRWEKYLDPTLIKGAFTLEEDNKIRMFVEKFGPKCWQKIPEYVPMRSAKQCRERWFNHLDPNVVDRDWTPEEDQLIFGRYQDIGPKWSLIARILPGRTDNAIKNRWHASISKRIVKDENGNDMLAPDTSKRKRRIAKQLVSRPAPVITNTQQENQSSPSETTSPKDEISFVNLSSKSASNSPSSFFSPGSRTSPIFLSPKFTEKALFSPLSGNISPNSPFFNVIQPNNFTIFDSFETLDH